MLGAIGRAFKTPDLRNKLLFTLGVIVLYRLGSYIPAPGIDYAQVQQCVANPQLNQGAFGLVNLFSGGALLQLSIFALGIMPYITASIITQLLRVVIPRFEALHKEGASGQAKLTQYTRYMTIGLGILNATTLVSTVRTGAHCGDEGRGIEDAQSDRHVPGVLGELRLAGGALLVEGLEARDHHAQELGDDARRDVGHDAEREDRQLEQRSAAEQVDEPERALVELRVGDALLDLRVVDAGGGDVRTEPVEHDHAECEEEFVPQIGRFESPPNCAEQASSWGCPPRRAAARVRRGRRSSDDESLRVPVEL